MSSNSSYFLSPPSVAAPQGLGIQLPCLVLGEWMDGWTDDRPGPREVGPLDPKAGRPIQIKDGYPPSSSIYPEKGADPCGPQLLLSPGTLQNQPQDPGWVSRLTADRPTSHQGQSWPLGAVSLHSLLPSPICS